MSEREQTTLPPMPPPTLAEAVAALRPIAKLDFPYGSKPGVWVADTRYCGDQVTVATVRQARAIVAAYDPSIPTQDGWSVSA